MIQIPGRLFTAYVCAHVLFLYVCERLMCMNTLLFYFFYVRRYLPSQRLAWPCVYICLYGECLHPLQNKVV